MYQLNMDTTLLELELGLDETQSDSSYFDYVEQKLMRNTKPRATVIESKQLEARLDEFAEKAKLWQEYSGY